MRLSRRPEPCCHTKPLKSLANMAFSVNWKEEVDV
jgi:hypothetical protein